MVGQTKQQKQEAKVGIIKGSGRVGTGRHRSAVHQIIDKLEVK